MEQDVKSFVEKYNERCRWNKDILKDIDIADYPQVGKIIDSYLSTKEITEEGYDLEHAKCYTYDNGTLELQAFSNETYGTSYFWVKPEENEDTYKKHRKEIVAKEIHERLGEILPSIETLIAEKEQLLRLKEKIETS